MKVSQILKEAESTLFSFELLPPLKGESVQSIYDCIDPLMEFNPSFIDVTYHREEYVYKKRENGLLEKFTTRKRPGTVGICAAIMNKYSVEAVPHLICGGFNKEETENALIDLHFLGIQNVLALRGDAIKSEGAFFPEPDGHAYASDLIDQIANMNNGVFLDGNTINAKTDFCISVAGYPEKHFEAPNLSTDLDYLKLKIDKGAEYIITQMFFDNAKFFEFVDVCRKNGIDVPIIPGLKPLATYRQLTILPSIFHIDIPEALVAEITAHKDDKKAIKQIGIEWCIQQSKELMAAGVPSLHYYSMGRSESVKAIASSLF